MDTHRILLSVAPQLDLGQHLVREGGGHDEAGMAHSASEVHQPTLRQQDQILPVLQSVTVHLRLDVGLLLAIFIKPLDLDLTVEMPDIADNRIVLHLEEMFAGEDILAASGRDKNITAADCILHCGDLVTLHAGLQSVDRVDFGDDDTAAEAAKRLGGAFTNVTVAGDQGNLETQR